MPKSKYKNVFWSQAANKWEVKIHINRKSRYFGLSKTEEEANTKAVKLRILHGVDYKFKGVNQSYLQEHFEYDATTGALSRIKRSAGKQELGCVGSNNSQGYLTYRIHSKAYLVHRLIFLREKGYWPQLIDHKNHNRSDNRLENLREVTLLENAQNASLRKDNKSGCAGVYLRKSGQWRSYIRVDNKQINLGQFEHIEDAIIARKKAEKAYKFHANHGKKAV